MMKSMRIWHSNISAFVAPMMLFFAISGALQIFRLHEAHGEYVPNAAIVALGNVHTNQTLVAGHRHGPEPEMGGTPRPAGSRPGGPGRDRPPVAALVLKWLFLIEALAFAGTTILGAWIGVTHPTRARTGRALLAAGTVVPVALLVLERAG